MDSWWEALRRNAHRGGLATGLNPVAEVRRSTMHWRIYKKRARSGSDRDQANLMLSAGKRDNSAGGRRFRRI